ncbi:MAG: CocE/NonD family hydrolase C-terminal non-catalytic domain-containing protein, partial [Steroidobacteraceae bacterium]
ARSGFAAQTPLVRVLFDNGAGAAGPGAIQSTYSADFTSWPPTGTTEELYFGRRGALAATPPGSQTGTTFTLDPGARPLTSLPPSGNAWAADPGWDWTTVPSADGIAFQTAPFKAATTIVGPATLDLWVRSTTPVEDFQASITEVRPSAGQEEYVTSGFLRSSNQVSPGWPSMATRATHAWHPWGLREKLLFFTLRKIPTRSGLLRALL